MEFVKFYISSFWIWAGITIGGMFVLGTFISLIKELFKFLGILARGYPKCNCDKEKEKTNEEKGKELAEKILKEKNNKNNTGWDVLKNAKVTANLEVK